MDMKISEVITNNPKKLGVLPDAVRQDARVASVISKTAASDAVQKATGQDKAMAFMKYCELKKRANKNYVALLQQQLANAETHVK